MKEIISDRENLTLQLAFSLDSNSENELFNRRLIIAFLSKVNSIILPVSPEKLTLAKKCLQKAKKIHRELDLNFEQFPSIKFGVGMLNPQEDNFFFCGEKTCTQNSLIIRDFETFLSKSKSQGIMGIRLNPGIMDESKFLDMWKCACQLFGRENVSLLLDRVNKSNAHLKNLIKMAYQVNSNLVVEIDGVSSSGGNDYFDSIQTLATADIIIKDFLVKERRQYKHLKIYLSGDINSKTKALAKLADVKYQGISFGTHYNQLFFKNLDPFLLKENLFENKELLLNAIEKINSLYQLSTPRQV
tara:strand:+ start:568 stop:1470 length:903 start_codon:yes stop_codon:yes gene_type:complete